jgi:hypothetical protein
MKYLVGILFLMFVFSPLTAQKKIALKELRNPENMVIDNENIYIGEGTQIHIYQRQDGTYKKKFGQTGRMEGQFVTLPGMAVEPYLYKDELMVNSLGRMSFFSKNGDFLREIKIGSHWLMFPFKDKFVGYYELEDKEVGFVTATIYDSKFKTVKEIARWKHLYQAKKDEMYLVSEPNVFQIYQDEILVAMGNQCEIKVFNEKGQQTRVIKKDVPKLKVTESFKKKCINFLKKDPRFFSQSVVIRQNFIFPEYFPAIRYFSIDQQKIYVLTYNQQPGKSEFYIFNVNGTFEQAKFIPFIDEKGFDVLSKYTIKDNFIYQLHWDNAGQVWKLMIHPI